ncbi:hypothetical protein Vretimale_17335 [Volvox reticuliferus]|uniref:Scytovirin-like domain-containing protein n=1 Tax=Volvox reticuliferus TaxID=1737510 RepID=A0A8J4BVQ8_9CHLO|nr:hypothetical protein Vretifemale_79 [Volvox reticuliferus]GIM14386.1 hypothetical protein Vretimale_17335 [Volvox reticuliferus]
MVINNVPGGSLFIISRAGTLLLISITSALLWKSGEGCYSDHHFWNESLNPGGPGRCEPRRKGCDCDGWRICSPAGYCQGNARPAVNSSSSSLPSSLASAPLRPPAATLPEAADAPVDDTRRDAAATGQAGVSAPPPSPGSMQPKQQHDLPPAHNSPKQDYYWNQQLQKQQVENITNKSGDDGMRDRSTNITIIVSGTLVITSTLLFGMYVIIWKSLKNRSSPPPSSPPSSPSLPLPSLSLSSTAAVCGCCAKLYSSIQTPWA